MSYKYPETIFQAIREERQDFLYNFIEIVPGLLFNQYETIKKAHKYYNSHYNSGDYEEIDGYSRKKVFYNITKWRADVATKMIDVDVKDFVLLSENYATEWQCYLLEKEMKAWLRKSKLGKILNEVVRLLPVYGSVVLKKVPTGAELVDLRSFFVDQAAKDLDSSRYIIQKHLMSASEIRKMASKWEHTEEVIEKFCAFVPKSYEDARSLNNAVSSPYAEIYERWAEVPQSWVTAGGSDKIWVKGHFIVSGVDAMLFDGDGKVTGEEGVILFKEEFKALPFKEVHYSKSEGRWLGIGTVEDCFEPQQQINKIRDSEAKSLELAALIIFQSKDDMAQQNLLRDVDNGDILHVKAPLERVDNTNHSLDFMKTASESYEGLADRITFSYNAARGEASPASSTLGAVQIQASQASSMFDFKRENIGFFLKEFIQELVFPELEKKINTPHIFRFSAARDEMEKVRDRVVTAYLRGKILETGDIPTQQEYEFHKAKLINDYRKTGDKIFLKIEKDFFANLEYEVSLEITGEGKDIQAQLTNVSAVLTELARNPELLQNPILKRLLYKQMTLMGMSVSELENAEAEAASQSPEQQQAQTQAMQARNLGGAAGQQQQQPQPQQGGGGAVNPVPPTPTSAQGQVIQQLTKRN